MKVAIIGWGSLIHDRGVLRLVDGWHRDGPLLPVEFARTSVNGTLSLVITPDHGTTVTTYWAESMHHDVSLVRENLRLRERTPDVRNIAAVTWRGEVLGRTRYSAIEDAVIGWLRSNRKNTMVDAAVWTSLKPKGLDSYTPKKVGAFIDSDRADKSRIQDYIRRAPAQTITALRLELEKLPGWEPIPVPPECFADGEQDVRD